MDHDDDREHRRRAAHETATLLHDHRERMEPLRGGAEASWGALRARIAAGEVGPLAKEDPPTAPRGRGVATIAVIAMAAVSLAAAAGVALWRLAPDAALQTGERGGLAAIFQRVDPDGSRRASARPPNVRPTSSVPGDMPPGTGATRETRPDSPVPRDSPAGDLARELAQVRAAGEALRDGRGEEGLAAADAYLRTFPTGAFIPEARMHRGEALCLLGRTDEARAAAAAFLRDLPDSPLRARVRSVCAEK